MMIGTNPKKLEFRLWPYVKHKKHIEYYTTKDSIEYEGLYFDIAKERWLPQNPGYGLKAVDAQVAFLNINAEEVAQAFNMEALSKYHEKESI